jgi:hypothetical protein
MFIKRNFCRNSLKNHRKSGKFPKNNRNSILKKIKGLGAWEKIMLPQPKLKNLRHCGKSCLSKEIAEIHRKSGKFPKNHRNSILKKLKV